jgi:hypothetical protein
VVALTVSTFLEGYVWTPIGATGLVMIFLGNITIFARLPGAKARAAKAAAKA